MIVTLGLLAPAGTAWAIDNQATGNIAGAVADLTASNTFVMTASTLALVKAAFLTDGTALTSGVSVPKGTYVKFLIYVDNSSGVAADSVSLQDSLATAFAYQPGTIKVDESQNTGASVANIYAAANAATPLTDAVSGADVVGVTGVKVTAGQTAGNAKLSIPAGKVWAMLFTVRVQ
jgi:uncharacterized repeat protein (TIGR01451 family)